MSDSAKILTEEELNKYLRYSKQDSGLSRILSNKVIVSHQNLLSANAELKKKFDESLKWLETIETGFYHNTEAELERCRTQAKCAREQLT